MGLSSKQEVNWVECSKYVFAFAHTYSINDVCNQMHLNTIQRTNWQFFRKVRRQLQCRSLAKYLCFTVWWTDFRKQFMKSPKLFKVDTLPLRSACSRWSFHRLSSWIELIWGNCQQPYVPSIAHAWLGSQSQSFSYPSQHFTRLLLF